jgi:AraC-like DNA-binding protein
VGVTRTLPIHLRFETTDPEAVKDRLSQTYRGADIHPPRDDPAFVYRQEVDGDAHLTLGRFHFGGRGQANLVLEDRFTVARLRSGQHQWEVNGHRGTGLMIIQPRQDYRAVLEFMRVETVDLSLTTLVQTARTVYGDDRLEVAFDNPHPVSPAMAHYWEGTHEIIHQGLTNPDIASVPLLHADLLRRMTVATLETFPLAGDPQVRRETVATRQAAYTRAVEFMHSAVSQPITVEDVARHACVSTLELTQAFSAHAGTTPGAYLRGLRLTGAHQDLVAAEPGTGDTVAAIAARWGFAHPGDFARRHRQAYGENPAHTLRR